MIGNDRKDATRKHGKHLRVPVLPSVKKRLSEQVPLKQT